MERRVTKRWRGGSVRKTLSRLEARLQEMVCAANWRERLRRSAMVTSWVMQGLVQTPEVAMMVAAYEVSTAASLPIFCFLPPSHMLRGRLVLNMCRLSAPAVARPPRI